MSGISFNFNLNFMENGNGKVFIRLNKKKNYIEICFYCYFEIRLELFLFDISLFPLCICKCYEFPRIFLNCILQKV